MYWFFLNNGLEKRYIFYIRNMKLCYRISLIRTSHYFPYYWNKNENFSIQKRKMIIIIYFYSISHFFIDVLRKKKPFFIEALLSRKFGSSCNHI